MAKDCPVLAAFLLDALDDFKRSLEGLDKTSAEDRLPKSSSISWIVAHVAQTLDAWIAGSMAGQPRHSYLASREFGFGGSGEKADWDTVCQALAEVMDKTRSFLETVSEAELTKMSPYQGGMTFLKGKNISGNYWLARPIAHVYYHIGEITAIRAAMGHKVAGFPGSLAGLVEKQESSQR